MFYTTNNSTEGVSRSQVIHTTINKYLMYTKVNQQLGDQKTHGISIATNFDLQHSSLRLL